MNRSVRWAGAVLLLALLAAAAVLAVTLQPAAAVRAPPQIVPQDLTRAAALLRAHGPRRMPPGRPGTLLLSERDLDVLLNHGLRRWPGAAGRVRLEGGALTLMLSIPAPSGLLGRWINVQARWRQTGDLPDLQSLRIGHLPLPGWLGTRVVRTWAGSAGLDPAWQLAATVVQRLRFTPPALQLTYVWRDDSAQRLLHALLPSEEVQRLRVHAEHLARLTAEFMPVRQAPLAQLMGPMFELARQRSQAGGDAAAENRAAIVVLALLANGRGVDSVLPVLPVPPGRPRARPLRLLLAGRDDFPRHFMVSAALAVEGEDALAQSLGLAKEVADARGGSGFSFNDMAANLAGARFGTMALQAPAELQARVAPGVSDDDLMPPWADLPQFMPEAEFVRRYGGIGATPYRDMMAEIESRVGALRLFR